MTKPYQVVLKPLELACEKNVKSLEKWVTKSLGYCKQSLMGDAGGISKD
jgi:hypothetical protein